MSSSQLELASLEGDLTAVGGLQGSPTSACSPLFPSQCSGGPCIFSDVEGHHSRPWLPVGHGDGLSMGPTVRSLMTNKSLLF